MTPVVLRGITKTYTNGVTAVAGLDFQIAAGELLVLAGPSGSGKSTTLRLIAGLERPTAGTIHFGGEEVTFRPAHRREAAVVFQTPGLFPLRTVRQNVEAGLRPSLLSRLSRLWRRSESSSGETRRQVDATARLLGMERLLDRLPSEISGGEQQRAALGRALVQRPKVLLLDEPLVHLNPDLRHELRQEIRRRQRADGITTLWVSHDPDEALATADRVGVLHAGKLLQLGPPAAVYERPANVIVAWLFGSRPMNLVRGTMTEAGFVSDGWKHPAAANERPQAAIGTELVWGIRPEFLRLDSDGPALATGTVVGPTEFAGDGGYVAVQLADSDVQLLVRTSWAGRPAAGERVTVRQQPNRACWFAADGMRIDLDSRA